MISAAHKKQNPAFATESVMPHRTLQTLFDLRNLKFYNLTFMQLYKNKRGGKKKKKK